MLFALLLPCLGLSDSHPRFTIPYSLLLFASILVFGSSLCFTLAVSMRQVSCVGYTPRAHTN